MKNKIEILPAALEDLKQIEDYYALQFYMDTAIIIYSSGMR